MNRYLIGYNPNNKADFLCPECNEDKVKILFYVGELSFEERKNGSFILSWTCTDCGYEETLIKGDILRRLENSKNAEKNVL